MQSRISPFSSVQTQTCSIAPAWKLVISEADTAVEMVPDWLVSQALKKPWWANALGPLEWATFNAAIAEYI